MKSKSGGPISFKAGQSILNEGDRGKDMFIVEEGQVEIFRRSEDKQEKRIAVMDQGDFFGEMSVIDDLPRAASARALTDCLLLSIDHSAFDQMLRRYPEVAVRMLRKMAARIRELEAMVETLESKPAMKVKKGARSVDTSGVAPVPPIPPAPPAPAPAPVAPAPAAPAPAPVAKAPAPPEPRPAPPPAPPPPTVPAPPPTVSTAAPTEVPPSAAPSGPVSWRLVLFETGEAVPIPDKDDIRVGRLDSVTGQRPDIDLTDIDTYKTTSRRHAKLIREGNRLFVREEIGTANGTFVNGQRVETGVNMEVKHGDWVQFGGVRAIVRSS